MARHYRSKHSRETPFQCEHCQRAFSRSDLLRRHYTTCAQAKASRGDTTDVRKSESPNDPVASTSTIPIEARLSHPGQSLARSGSSSNSPYDSDLALPVPPASFVQPTYSIQGPSPPGSQPSPLYAISPYSIPTNTSTSTLATSNGSPDDYRTQKDLFPPEPTPSSHLPISSGLPAPHLPPPAGFANTQLPDRKSVV